MKSQEIELESPMELAQVIQYLEDIATSLKAGRVCVQHGEEQIELAPTPEVTVAVRAKKKSSKESIALKIGWRIPEIEPADDKSPSTAVPTPAALCITSGTK